ncbi:hypothetical protein HMI55_004962 [Coelomomyces lativittatus]|nr:hypothetical protein HMI55_004962 [Coelomomyces lativittatus]
MTKKHEAKSPLTTSDTVHNHDPDLSTLQHRIHQAISCTLYASSSNPQEELDDLTKVTNALHYLDLWPIDTLLLNTMDATHVHEKLENVKLELIRNQLKETDKWIQKINGYETKLSENQSILANILDQCSKTHTMLGKFVEKGIEYQNQLMKLEVQKVEVENLVQQYALSSAESNVLSSPISVINETLFKALNKAIALKEKAIKDLDYPNTQLSLVLFRNLD